MRGLAGPLSWVCLAGSFVMVGGLLADRVRPKDPEGAIGPLAGGLVVEPARIDLGAVAPDSPREFAVEVANRSGRPARLAGTPTVCRPSGCVQLLRGPAVIPPHRVATYRFEFRSKSSGRVAVESILYFTSGDQIGATAAIRVEARMLVAKAD